MICSRPENLSTECQYSSLITVPRGALISFFFSLFIFGLVLRTSPKSKAQFTFLLTTYDVFLFFLFRGAYGTVKRCTHKTKRNNYAAKIIKTANSTVRKTVLREIEVMRALGTHNKLVELVDAYQTPFEIVMVLEL